MTAMIRHHTDIAHARATTRKPVFAAAAPHILPSWYEDEYAKAWHSLAHKEGHRPRIPIGTSAGVKTDVQIRREKLLEYIASNPSTSEHLRNVTKCTPAVLTRDLYWLEAAGKVQKTRRNPPIWSVAGEAGQ